VSSAATSVPKLISPAFAAIAGLLCPFAPNVRRFAAAPLFHGVPAKPWAVESRIVAAEPALKWLTVMKPESQTAVGLVLFAGAPS